MVKTFFTNYGFIRFHMNTFNIIFFMELQSNFKWSYIFSKLEWWIFSIFAEIRKTLFTVENSHFDKKSVMIIIFTLTLRGYIVHQKTHSINRIEECWIMSSVQEIKYKKVLTSIRSFQPSEDQHQLHLLSTDSIKYKK